MMAQDGEQEDQYFIEMNSSDEDDYKQTGKVPLYLKN